VAQLQDLDGNSLDERKDVIGGREERKDVIGGGEDQRSDVIGGKLDEEEEEGIPQPSQKADLPLVVSAIEDKVIRVSLFNDDGTRFEEK
jgi:hypothetical protein